ncbi:MAG: 50S ribosomal protein L18 [Bdellovibrionota bacterium]
MATLVSRSSRRSIRKERIHKKIHGTAERPRVSVFRSNKHIAAQVVNDAARKTLFSISTTSKEFRGKGVKPGTVAAAKAVGALVAEKAKGMGLTSVVFDRGGYKYHGAVKALADAAREGGLSF